MIIKLFYSSSYFLYRMRLNPGRSANMVVCKDYWMSRRAMESYRLCEKCPNYPDPQVCYNVSCAKHNKV